VNGLDPLHASALAFLALIAIAIGTWTFDRRDLTA
jgi:hypothetical protein